MQKTLSFLLLFLTGLMANSQNTYDWTGQLGGNDDEDFYDMILGPEDNLYVCGRFDGVVDLNPFSGYDGYNDIGSFDGFIAKFSTDSVYQWGMQLGGASSNIYVRDLFITADSTLIAAGTFKNTVDFDPGPGDASHVTPGDWDAFFASYDLDGNFISVDVYAGPGTQTGDEIGQDNNGDLFFLGTFDDDTDFNLSGGTEIFMATSQDAFVVKTDDEHNFIWARHLEGTSDDTPVEVEFTDADDIIILGNFSGDLDMDPGVGTDVINSGASYDVFLLELSSAGDYNWGKGIIGLGAVWSSALERDATGNLYISGRFFNTIDFDPGPGEMILEAVDYSGFNNYNGFISQYDSSGNLNWAHKIGEHGYAIVWDMTITDANEMYIAGTYKGKPDMDPGPDSLYVDTVVVNDGFISKFDLSGNFQFTETFGGIGWVESHNIVKDDNNNLYYSGEFTQYSDFDPSDSIDELTAYGFWDTDVYITKLGETPPVQGCTDPTACNYNPNAVADDGSCILGPCSTCIGDANVDGSVNVLDLISVSSNFACTAGCYGNGDADFNGEVNVLDLVAISSNFGSDCE